MIPINGQIQIEPEVTKEFVTSMKETYDEVGIVVAVAKDILNLPVGARVFFDSWQASKFPKDNQGNYYWYVPFDAIKAYEIPAERVQI